MKKLFTFVLTALAFLFATELPAQQTDKTAQNKSEAIKMLNGTWQWTESRFASRGVPPTTKTPASTKEQIAVTFKPDNTAQLFVNGKLTGTYAYKITQQPNDYLIISFSDDKGNNLAAPYLEEGPLTVSASQLIISGGYNDAGSNQTFKKVTATKKARKPARTKKR